MFFISFLLFMNERLLNRLFSFVFSDPNQVNDLRIRKWATDEDFEDLLEH